MRHGRVYKIECECCNQIYVGSTTSEIRKRMSAHRMCSVRGMSRLYRHMREVGVDKFRISEITDFFCESVREVRLVEQHHMDLLSPTLNEHRAHNTPAQTRAYNIRYRNLPTSKAYQKRYQARPIIKAKKIELVECCCGKLVKRNALGPHGSAKSHHVRFAAKVLEYIQA